MIKRAVKNPHRSFQCSARLRCSPSLDLFTTPSPQGHHGSNLIPFPVLIRTSDFPSPLPSHTETRDIKPLFIDIDLGLQMVDQPLELSWIPPRYRLDGCHVKVAKLPHCIATVTCI